MVVIAVVACAKGLDAMSEIAQGPFQRELEMRTAAISLMCNGGASVLLVALSLVVWGTVDAAAIAYAAGSFVTLLAWDWPHVAALLGEKKHGASLRAALGLTGAEAEIALRLANGESREHIAADRGTSAHTLGTQIKSILRKSEVGREAELTALVNRLLR